MKAHALAGRDKPKDAYDLCYCLEHFPAGRRALAEVWKGRRNEKDVARAIEVLSEKFATVNSFGPSQIVEFHASPDGETQTMQARRAFEVVREFLSFLLTLTLKDQASTQTGHHFLMRHRLDLACLQLPFAFQSQGHGNDRVRKPA
jgi:hypothetical protein